MILKEAKTLKWGDTIVPSQQHRDTFRTGKRVESGLFLGFSKDNRLRVVHKDSGTVNSYHWHFWDKPNQTLNHSI